MFVKVYSTNPQSSCQFSIVVHENVYTIVDDFFFPFFSYMLKNVRICRKQNISDIILSIKINNATRLEKKER